MADTSIEWTNRVWNFLAGCSLTSPGCTNCYAMKQAARIERMNPALAHYRGLTKASKAGPVWTGKVAYAGDAKLTEPLRVRKPAMWFVNSMSDLFHEDVPDEVIDKAFAVMALAPQHTFQVLTKRSARMREYLSKNHEDSDLFERIADAGARLMEDGDATFSFLSNINWPLPNVWLGVSVEDQARADERVPDLLATPAAIRWISAEPLLGPVDLNRIHESWTDPHSGVRTDCWESALNGKRFDIWGECDAEGFPRLDWVVAGGESGRGARPMHPDWARALRDQCAAADVPFFFKQHGEYLPGHYSISRHAALLDPSDGKDRGIVLGPPPHNHVHEWGDGHIGIRVGKKKAGRLLDGVEHNAFPKARS